MRVQTDLDKVYLAFNKPLGVVTTMQDELGRPCVGDYVAKRRERLFHVGRLDTDTEGLLLLTNDGELAHRLQHRHTGSLKTYVAQVPGPIPRDLGKRLRAGIELEDGPVASTASNCSTARPAARWSRSSCTKGATTSCVACWRRSVTRSSPSRAPRSDRSCSVTPSPARRAR